MASSQSSSSPAGTAKRGASVSKLIMQARRRCGPPTSKGHANCPAPVATGLRPPPSMRLRQKQKAAEISRTVVAAETGMGAPIGQVVIDLLSLAYASNVPCLLEGSHGVGKSQICKQAADELGIDFISRDLSLMEPPDLVGLPKIEGGATSFIPPAFLPRETGRGGFLLIEEINRAPRYMQASCLELLTSRQLNSYQLPPGWLPIACINPKTEGYHVDLLDAALMSRFMRVEVSAAVGSWVAWAQESGIHPKIIEYVEITPNVLDESEGGVNPRSWSYASNLLLGNGEQLLAECPDTLVVALNGLIGPVHTTAFLQLLLGTEVALTPADIVDNWSNHKARVKRWAESGRLDLLTASLRSLLRWMEPDSITEQLRENAQGQKSVRSFFQLLPGDLRERAESWVKGQGCTFLLPQKSKKVRGKK